MELNRLTAWWTGINRSRRLRHGLNAIILTVAVLGIVVMANVVASDHRWRVDVTRTKQHSLSELTRQVVASLDKPVTVTSFMQEGDAFSARIRNLLEEYAHSSPFITVEFVDPERNPSQARLYGVETLDTTVFECEGRRRQVPMREAFQMDPTIGLIDFTGEQAFTNALMAVLQERERIVYFTEGHEELSPYAELGLLRQGLGNEGFQAKTINLGREGAVPEDADVVIIAGPSRDLDSGEVDILRAYMAEGGRLIALVDPSLQPGGLPRLSELLVSIGVQLDDTLVLDPVRCYFMDQVSPIPGLEYHQITDGLIRNGLMVVLPYSRSVGPYEGYEGNLAVSRLLWTSEDAWGETNLGGSIGRDDDDLPGPLKLAVVVDEPGAITEEGPQRIPRAVVVGTSTFVTDSVIEFQGNLDLALNMVSWLAGDDEKLAIRPKDPQFERVFMSADQAKSMFNVTVFGIPGFVLVVGTVVWLRRRGL